VLLALAGLLGGTACENDDELERSSGFDAAVMDGRTASEPDRASSNVNVPFQDCAPDAGVVGGTFPDASIGLNDVSMLFPLPGHEDELIGASAPGLGGALFAREQYAVVPRLLLDRELTNEVVYGEMRVVGARVDPCFRASGTSTCQPQVRVVLQPVTTFEGRVMTRDVAVHVSYDLSVGSFDELVRELLALKRASEVGTSGALDVHPIMASEGLHGPFAAGLRDILLKHVGAMNVSRFATMTLEGADRGAGNAQRWIFSIRVRGGDGRFSVLPVPEIDSTFRTTGEVVTRIVENGDEDARRFANSIAAMAAPTALLFDAKAAMTSPRSALALAIAATYRAENPELVRTEEVRCSTCHTATPLRLWAEGRLCIDASEAPERYRHAGYDLSLRGAGVKSTRSLRAFGYLEDVPSISQRTVNDSARIAAVLASTLVTP
jgi:hypothetical protein